jgi:hypothetical protein
MDVFLGILNINTDRSLVSIIFTVSNALSPPSPFFSGDFNKSPNQSSTLRSDG